MHNFSKLSLAMALSVDNYFRNILSDFSKHWTSEGFETESKKGSEVQKESYADSHIASEMPRWD